MNNILIFHPFQPISTNKKYFTINDQIRSKYLEYENVFETEQTNFSLKEKQDLDLVVRETIDFILEIYQKILFNEKSLRFSTKDLKINLGWILEVILRCIYSRYKKINKSVVKYNIDTFSLLEFEEIINFKETSDITTALEKINEESFFFDNYINQSIINFYFKDKKIIKIKKKLNRSYKKISNLKNFFKILIFNLNSLISNVFSKNKVLFINSFLTNKDLLLIQLIQKKFPIFFPNINFKYNNINISLRKKLISSYVKENFDFKNFALNFFLSILPSCYLEDIQNLILNSKKFIIPESISSVFTANAFATNDVAKMLISQKKYKLIIGQHGSNYGTINYRLNPSIEEIICDKFVTWGYKQFGSHYPAFNFVSHNVKKNENKSSTISLVLGVQKSIYYYDECFNFAEYIKKNKDLIQQLPQSIQNKIILRPHKQNFHVLDEISFWENNLSNIKIDNLKNDLTILLNKSQLVIFTYESSFFFHCLNINKPCIYVSLNNLSDIKNSVKKYYSYLVDTNIIFTNTKNFLKHIEKVYVDPSNWWYNKKTQDSITLFNLELNNHKNNRLNSFCSYIEKIS